ncbi:MAG TPA: hypothetical protein HA263_07810 [Methanoregulaceae archaeon]|nr:hypothetical protein [Methanoregulaceae archaeon]
MAHLNGGGNYGVFPVAGSGIVILDADDYVNCVGARLLDGVEDRTFTVETGGSRGEHRKFHFYFRLSPPLEGKFPLFRDGVHLGELYCQHPVSGKGYVVGPNSLHPEGERYRVALDVPIADVDKISYAMRLSRLAPKKADEETVARTVAASGSNGLLSDRLGLRVTDFLMPDKATHRGQEIEGAHPVHGSGTGSNLTISPDNTWYCRRCQTGGGPLEAFAVAEHILDCGDVRRGCLKPVWGQVMDRLRERGYAVDPPQRPFEEAPPAPVWAAAPEEDDPAVSKAVTDQCKMFNMTDSGNADRLVKRYSHMIRYCHPRRAWLVWDSRRWLEDRYNIIVLLARRTSRKIYSEAEAESVEERRKALARWAQTSESEPRMRGMVALATPDPDVSIRPDDLDADRNLFNLRNGTLDLTSLVVRPHRKEDLLTKIAGVEYDKAAVCPRWEDHMRLIFDNDDELIASTQELLGYAMLFGNPLQIFPIWWGGGQNGKSVTLAVIRAIFGEYAVSASADLFMAQKNEGGPRPDLLALRDARLVTAIEAEKGHRLNEALIKQMTGGDDMTVRGLYRDPETFPPAHLAILATNPKPIIRGVEFAIWRRVLMWPFAVTIPKEKRIVDYEKVLLEEAPGILNWMIEGLRRYRANGNRITIPKKVQAATDQYKTEMDILAPFFLEECVLKENAQIERNVIYDRYKVWCADLGDDPMHPRTFATALKERGITEGSKVMGLRTWLGIRMKNEAEHQADAAAGYRQGQL